MKWVLALLLTTLVWAKPVNFVSQDKKFSITFPAEFRLVESAGNMKAGADTDEGHFSLVTTSDYGIDPAKYRHSLPAKSITVSGVKGWESKSSIGGGAFKTRQEFATNHKIYILECLYQGKTEPKAARKFLQSARFH